MNNIGAGLTQLCDELHLSAEPDDDSSSLSPNSFGNDNFVDCSDDDADFNLALDCLMR